MHAHHKIRHRTATIEGLEVFYREAGERGMPTVLLLHGFPSSSHTFAPIMPVLAEVAHVVAPDLPGFGMSSAPTVAEYDYTFENISRTIEHLLTQIGVESFFVYVHDFGAPVAYDLALRDPDRIRGLIIQSGNAHEEGLGDAWATAKAYWAEPTDARRAALPEWLDFDGTRDQYVSGVPDRLLDLLPPEAWHLDWERMSRPGNVEAQFALFTDYGRHVARFEQIGQYLRTSQPPTLLLWGRHDPYFDVAEVLAYHRDLERFEAHLYDGSHFLLETHGAECAALMRDFVSANP